MEKLLDLIMSNLSIAVTVFILVLVTIVYLIKIGYLKDLSLGEIKFNFNRTKEEIPTLLDSTKQDSKNLSDYKLDFSKNAVNNITLLRITQDEVIKLVESEFTHHVNYFRWDLQDYPLPVQNGLIIVLDKIGNRITFRAVKKAEMNELELTGINDLLAIYRRLSRFEYRLKTDYIMRSQTTYSIVTEHKETLKRLIRHYEIFRGIPLPGKETFPSTFLLYLIEQGENEDRDAKVRKYIENLPENSKGFAHNITSALCALTEIDTLTANMENGLISQASADQDIILCLERSLQYIHKMINTCLEQDGAISNSNNNKV